MTNNTVYDEKTDYIVNLGGSTATYTVPSGVSGTYDIYLEVSRGLSDLELHRSAFP